MKCEGRVRVHPRLSAAKMGEYLDASAQRRERILRDQKFPPAFKTTRYQDAFDLSRRIVIRGEDVSARLLIGAQRLREKPCESTFDEQALTCSVAAIERFARLYPALAIENLEATFVGQRGLDQLIEGVTVSAHPLVLLRSHTRSTNHLGALLLVFRKEKALGDRAGRATAELLRGALEASSLVPASCVKPELCVVVDVFHDDVYRASKHRKRIMDDVEAACREIAVRWPTVGRRAA